MQLCHFRLFFRKCANRVMRRIILQANNASHYRWRHYKLNSTQKDSIIILHVTTLKNQKQHILSPWDIVEAHSVHICIRATYNKKTCSQIIAFITIIATIKSELAPRLELLGALVSNWLVKSAYTILIRGLLFAGALCMTNRAIVSWWTKN